VSRSIAVSGKGGVGKTLVSTLLIKWLTEKNIRGILAIDADPDSNMAESLGIGFGKTLGDVREELIEKKLPPGVDKRKYLEGKLFEITEEKEKFDLLVMGRPEGSGCYCALNHILRGVIDSATKTYEYTIIDAEAGLEHLSRRTTENVDVMLIVTDTSKKGFRTASRIRELARELNIKFDKMFLIINRVKKADEKIIKKGAELTDLEVILEIPEDPLVSEYDLKGIPLIDLPGDSGAYSAMSKMLSAAKWI
jgi:CO dehydrogenase maturation factor